MAANVTGMRVEATTVGGTAEKRGGAHRRRIGIAGLLAAILVAVVIGGTAMHERGTSHPASPAIPRTATTSAETRFLEENTITLPSALGSETHANAGTGQGFTEQQVMEFDALTAIDGSVALTVTKSMGPAEYDAILVSLENVGGMSPAVLTSDQQRFLEANTILPGVWASTYMEAVTPLPGQNR